MKRIRWMTPFLVLSAVTPLFAEASDLLASNGEPVLPPSVALRSRTFENGSSSVRVSLLIAPNWPVLHPMLIEAAGDGPFEVQFDSASGGTVTHLLREAGPHLVWAMDGYSSGAYRVTVRADGRLLGKKSLDIDHYYDTNLYPVFLDTRGRVKAGRAQIVPATYVAAHSTYVAAHSWVSMPAQALPRQVTPLLALSGVAIGRADYAALSMEQQDVLVAFVAIGGTLAVFDHDGTPLTGFEEAVDVSDYTMPLQRLSFGEGQVLFPADDQLPVSHLHRSRDASDSLVRRFAPQNEWDAAEIVGRGLPLDPPIGLIAILLLGFSILVPIGTARMLRRGLRAAMSVLPLTAVGAAIAITALSFSMTGGAAHELLTVKRSLRDHGHLVEQHLAMRTGWSGAGSLEVPAGTAVIPVGDGWRRPVPLLFEIEGAQTRVRVHAEHPHAAVQLALLRYETEVLPLRAEFDALTNTGEETFPRTWVVNHPEYGSQALGPLAPDVALPISGGVGDPSATPLNSAYQHLAVQTTGAVVVGLEPAPSTLGLNVKGSKALIEPQVAQFVRLGAGRWR